MSTSTVLTTFASLQNDTSATADLNSNFAAINVSLADALSLSGQTPNQMNANLDMNSNAILNLPPPTNLNSPLRLQDVTSINQSTFSINTLPVGGSANQILHKNSSTNYDTSWTSNPFIQTITTNSVGLDGSVTGQTLLLPAATAAGTLNVPNGPDTIVARNTTDTLTNKTVDTASNTLKVAGTSLTAVNGTGQVVLATSPTLTTPNIGNATAGSITASGAITSASETVTGQLATSSPTASFGYVTGAGGGIGQVSQATSKSTAVTCNANCGSIIMNAASLAATTSVAFTLNNTAISATDVIIVNFRTGNSANSYTVMVDNVSPGSCAISLRNYTAGALAEAVQLNFAVISAVTT